MRLLIADERHCLQDLPDPHCECGSQVTDLPTGGMLLLLLLIVMLLILMVVILRKDILVVEVLVVIVSRKVVSYH